MTYHEFLHWIAFYEWESKEIQKASGVEPDTVIRPKSPEDSIRIARELARNRKK